MKQIFQYLDSGKLEVVDVPSPTAKAGQLLIQTCRTLISAGTERMVVQFGRSNLLDKARTGALKLNSSLLDLILNSCDLMNQLVGMLDGADPPARFTLDQLIRRINAAVSGA